MGEVQARYNLTEREVEIMRLCSCGYSDSEICDRLHIARTTLKTHLNNIHGKIDYLYSPSRENAAYQRRIVCFYIQRFLHRKHTKVVEMLQEQNKELLKDYDVLHNQYNTLILKYNKLKEERQ